MKATYEQWLRAADLYKRRELFTYADVARMLGVSSARVCQVFRVLGVTPFTANGPPSRVDPDEAKHLREQGWTLHEIGERFGVSKSRIYQILRDKTDYYDDEEINVETSFDARFALMLNDGMRPEMARRLLGMT